ncbi:hypothetical protein RB653_003092 [Dictyostelium firmibasis]|uniref:Periplasmic copper-binding protein NosD beta helix domain-containing protein n=1 Tax=Dictyostelium firmibasis TaxID=79012 RepID=A0AAN7TRK9_9MYCE
MFDDYSHQSKQLPSHQKPQDQQPMNYNSPNPGVYNIPNQQPQQHNGYPYQQQYQYQNAPPPPPPPYGYNHQNMNKNSPQPGVYNSPKQHQHQQQQFSYPAPTSSHPQQYTNYSNHQGLTLPPPPLSPPINNITNNYNNYHHHHYHNENNNSVNSNSQTYSPPRTNKLSPTITGSGSISRYSTQLSPTNSRNNNSNNNFKVNPIPGAYGDGVHDDTKAVLNYFNTFPTNVINIPPGNYLITAPLIIKKNNIQLLGSPNVKFTTNFPIWLTPPLAEGFINTAEYVFVLTGDNIVLDSINCSCITAGTLSSSFLYLCGNGFIMRNCIVDNFNQGIVFGILNDCSGKIPPGSHFNNIKITANQITNVMGIVGGSICYGDGIAFFGCSNVVISNNFVSAKDGFTPRNGINSGPEGFLPSTNIQLINNTIRGDWDYSLTTEGGNQCTVSNNDVQGSCICGIIERGTGIKVSNNTIHIVGREKEGQTESTGIQFYGVDNGEISNNSVMGSAKYGILIKPSHESGGGSNSVVENNTIDGDFYNCIFMSNASQAKIHGNVVMGKSDVDSCVGLQLWYSNGLDIQGNNIDLPSGTACICSGAKNVNVLSNTMMTSRAGFYICQASDEICIQNNDLLGVTQTKFDQSSDNSSVTTSQNYGLDYSPPENNTNNN